MSEYTPTTEHDRAQYARQENYDEYYEGDWYLTPDGQLSAQDFDRWLAQHEAKVRDDYRDRLIDALRETKKDLDVTDPFHSGFVTGVEQLIKVLDSVKERAGKSFPIIRGDS